MRFDDGLDGIFSSAGFSPTVVVGRKAKMKDENAL